MNAKRQKLQDQFVEDAPGQLQKEGSGSKIFAGIRIHVNGYTKPSSDELKRLMMLHGGGYEHYLYRTRVTHVIATNLPNSKVKELKGLKVVSPEWIIDSVAAGKLLPYTKYQLYTAQSGLQKGLQSYSVSRENSDQSVGTLQPTNSSNYSLSDESSNHLEGTLQSINSNSHISELSVPDVSYAGQSTAAAGSLDEEMDFGVEKSPMKRQTTATASTISPAKAGDPKFLNEFYSHSRLHYLSTWKAEWKNYVNELQKKGNNFPGRDRLRKVVMERGVTSDVKGKLRRCVMHIDMDCFFVSVGLRKRPDLRGKPVAVTHSRGKGATVDPESDLNFEKHEWAKKRLQGGKKGPKAASDNTSVSADFSFPDQSDSSSEDDVTDDIISVPKTTTEPFHSMAEIASCSYEARQAGVRNGMFMGEAKRICPDIVTIPYDFEGYKAVSRVLYDTVASYTHDIEAVSCDEMLVDCTDLLADTGATPQEFATLLRAELYEKTGCPASAGLGSNILQARMATKKAKPNGQFHLTEDLVQDYIRSQSVKDIPGVGWSLSKRLEALKVVTCGDLQRHSLDSLQKEFGTKTGQSLYRYCRGQDDRPIKMEHQRKSVSAEVNYGIRFTTDIEAVRFMEELSEEVCNRLKSIKMKGKTVTLKLMVRREDAPRQTSKFMGHGICNNLSKSVTLPVATDDPKIVARETISLLRQQKAPPEDLRGIGIQVQKLESAELGLQGGNKNLPSILSYTVGQSASNLGNQSNLSASSNHKSGSVNSTESNAKSSSSLDFNSHRTSSVSKTSEAVNAGANLTKKVPYVAVEDTDSSSSVGEDFTISRPELDINIKKGQNQPGKSSEHLDLLEELARRQTSELALPPLPCLPDIKTPESAKKSKSRVAMATDSTTEADYFPSPSQVDPAVLEELPPEIRQQVEKELLQRRNSKKTRSTAEFSAPGCSHWQGDNSVASAQSEADEHSHDAIVALPSPSQIDQSCLEALPESVQAELRQAYARQGSRVATVGTSQTGRVQALQLKQAQSPVKSPNKRSPGKGSPHFKVPRGRPSQRGQKKGVTKKTLFKDQVQTVHQSDSARIEDKRVAVSHIDIDARNQFHSASTENHAITYDEKTIARSSEQIQETETSSGVNLCGAVKLDDVRLLLSEWITSTSDPQQDDEEVVQKYLHDLIQDKNLELVDLVLKFMLRKIRQSKSTKWLTSLRRVFDNTQLLVFDCYGSRLASIQV